ncbi:hypothetical protein MSAN_02294400 [Mycena sanguinolenta]|uniref:Uncharacterized protein n=1 Tax=Mycena sanguinolenta TaxID=230812 RepID=A0A8H6X9M5_9AGAR|nr:hypothetical protein MSAN_02294400 [Mycena sanguinolenta]
MAVPPKFHGSDLFGDNLISLVIECISDWGNDDFRPEHSFCWAVIQAEFPNKLRLPAHCPHIAVSNESAFWPEDFVQALIYAGERVTTEKIQDFLRSNSPDTIPEEVFEFYHRHIDEARKKFIQEGMMNGTLRGIAATDAFLSHILPRRVLAAVTTAHTRIIPGRDCPPGRENETNEEVAAAVSDTLLALRDTIVKRKFPGQRTITGKILMSDLVVDALANRARAITSLDALKQAVNWVWASELGAEVVEAIQARLLDFPDLERLARGRESTGKGARSA